MTPEFDRCIAETLTRLQAGGKPSRNALLDAASELLGIRQSKNLPGLWPVAPLMVTATIDDGFGHGLEVIRRFAEAVGLQTHPLGLLQKPEAIIAACNELMPAILGLTVLQFDSEEMLARIRDGIPARTQMICGGPVFQADPELAERAGVDHVAKDAVRFLDLLLRHRHRFGRPSVIDS